MDELVNNMLLDEIKELKGRPLKAVTTMKKINYL